MKQKLVSIYLTDQCIPAYIAEKANMGIKEELLDEYLTDGWVIRSITPLTGSGAGEALYSGGWVIVLLEQS